MGKNTSGTDNRPIELQAPRGKAVSIGLVVATKAVTLAAMLVTYYLIAFFAAIRVVPLTMGFVKSGSGITMDMPVETVLSVWIVPALFLVALIFTLVLVTMRALWRLRSRSIKAVSRWAFGEETDEAAPIQIATKKAPNKTSTKAA